MAELETFEQNFDESRMITPGQILKASRQASGLSEKDVAKKLRLSMSVIHDIENDRYDHFSAFIYLHGYLRAYARLMGVAEEKVMKALEAMDLKKEWETTGTNYAWVGSNAVSIPVYAHSGNRKNKALKWISLAVLAVLILLVVMWWHGQQKANESLFSKRIETQPISNAESANLPIANSQAVVNTSANNKKEVNKPVSTSDKKSSQHADIKASYNKQHNSLHPNYMVEPASKD